MAIQIPQTTFGKSEALAYPYSDDITLTDTPENKTMVGSTCRLAPPVTGVPKSLTVDLVIYFRKNTAITENFMTGELQISNDAGVNWYSCTDFSDMGKIAATATDGQIRFYGFTNLIVNYDLSTTQDFIFRLHSAGADAADIVLNGLQPILCLQNISWEEVPL